MKATSLARVSAFTCSTMSTTGPQTRLWHSCGVAKVRTTGFLPSDVGEVGPAAGPCAGGTRVSSFAASPPTSVSVGVWTLIALSPTSGGAPPLASTCDGSKPLVATQAPVELGDRRGPACLPLRLNGTSAT